MKKTYLIDAHVEETPESPYTIGIMLNHDDDGNRVDSFPYLYRDEIYVFFETILEMIEYMIYNNKKIKRAYMREVKFDKYYDNYIDGVFKDILEWVTE